MMAVIGVGFGTGKGAGGGGGGWRDDTLPAFNRYWAIAADSSAVQATEDVSDYTKLTDVV